MTPQQFIAKWKQTDLSERSACQQHFLDICEMLGQPKPAEVDPTGEFYTFEYGVEKTDGGKGFADVWKKGFFGWEYKGKHKDLRAAYQQLLMYRESLENPPLLVVCDLDRFEIHTNFTATVKEIHAFRLTQLADPANLQLLRDVFTNPGALKPGQTTTGVTEEVAARFAKLADGMSARGIPPQQAAHFLMKLMFCMFAEDIELLPRDLFTRTVANAKEKPKQLSKLLKGLFQSMASGEPFGADPILYFNGGLFADTETIDLEPDEISELLKASRYDWSAVEPTIFGTLFLRTLDPAHRAQIGAQYTSRQDIETLLQPVMLAPLRREWAETKGRADQLWEKVKAERGRKNENRRGESKARRDFEKAVLDFADRLTRVTVLDPACGSGNFLYVAIRLLLDLEKEVLTYAAEHGLQQLPWVSPRQLRGLEINEYAYQLAQVVLWIGFLQWMHENGQAPKLDPVLDTFANISNMDAILDLTDPANPREPEWPEAEFIVGNPPFLGDKKMRGDLGDSYVEAMRGLYEHRVPNQSDLCCYWFEKGRAQIAANKCQRVGLLATQGIRGGANRTALARIKQTGDIFWAYSDRDWILDGATVHVSMVGFDNGGQKERTLDGRPVVWINANLSARADTTQARLLHGNLSIAFIGVSMHGPFDLTEEAALKFLEAAGNPGGRVNSDTIRPILNAFEISQRPDNRWVIYFDPQVSESEAAMYERPFEFVVQTVKPIRDKNRRASYKQKWWIHGESRPALQRAIKGLERFVATQRVGKHRLFVWMRNAVLPSDATVAFARSDDFFLGVLHSALHEVWARAQGTQVRERESGFRYTPSTCFETFPFPEPTADQQVAIAAAAKELDTLRNSWLNPPEWTKTAILEFPGSVNGPWHRYLQDAKEYGIGTVRYPRTVAKDAACAAKLKARTLTNLYNEMPTRLKNAHRKLDQAVFAAYGWPADLSDEDVLGRLLELNLNRSARAGP